MCIFCGGGIKGAFSRMYKMIPWSQTVEPRLNILLLPMLGISSQAAVIPWMSVKYPTEACTDPFGSILLEAPRTA